MQIDVDLPIICELFGSARTLYCLALNSAQEKDQRPVKSIPAAEAIGEKKCPNAVAGLFAV